MSEQFNIEGKVTVANTTEAEAALKKLQDKQEAANKAQERAASKLATAAMVGGAALLGSVAIMAKEGAAAETVQKGLANQLKNTGQYSASAMTHIDKLTNSLRKQTGVSDEVQKSALAFASTMKLTESQSESLLPLLMDMSSVTGMDLQQGFRASAQSLQGNVGLFQRYGVIIKKSADGTVDFGDILKQLAVYQGSLTAKMSGAEGAMTKFKSAVGEAAEGLGSTLLPAATKLISSVTGLVEKFHDLPASMTGSIATGTLVAGAFLLIAGGAAKAIIGIAHLKTSIDLLTAGAGWSGLMKLLGGAGGPALAIGGAAVIAIKGIGTVAREQIKNPVSFFNNPGKNAPYYGSQAGTLSKFASIGTSVTQGAGGAYWQTHAYPSRTWTDENQVGLNAVQAGDYTHQPPTVDFEGIAAGNLDLQHRLYDASHTEKQQELHDLELDVAAWRKAGYDKVLITQLSAARRAEIEKKYVKDTTAATASTPWSAISVAGTNVTGLSAYIGSLSSPTKVKKAELQLTLKVEGTSIKVDQAALGKLKETLGNLVFQKVMTALGGTAAYGG